IFMLPLLIIFMLVFQTETVAQNRDSESAIKGAQTEKDNQKDSISVQENFHVLVKNNLSRKDLRELKKSLSKIKDFKADFTNIEFNDSGELTNIHVDAQFGDNQKEVTYHNAEGIFEFELGAKKGQAYVASVSPHEQASPAPTETHSLMVAVDKNSKSEYLQRTQELLKTKMGIAVEFYDQKRNASGQLTQLGVSLKKG